MHSNGNSEDGKECPLCMELLEVDDINFFPCTCGYQICRFCWHRIRTDENKLCPACRKEYTENPADFKPLSHEQIVALKSQKRQKDNQKKHKMTENRKHLANIRVVQKNLVFVVGLPPRLADPDILKKQEYFGKYGKIHKVVINPSTSYAGAQGPSASAYVTYVHNNDALRAIHSVNNVAIDGRLIKTSLGTTKYCSHFMKNQQCPKNDCMYLHELGAAEASFTTEEMQQGKHTEYIKRLNDAMNASSSITPSSSNASSASAASSLQSTKPNVDNKKIVNAVAPSSPCSSAQSKINTALCSTTSTKQSTQSTISTRSLNTDAISQHQKESWPSLSSSPGSAKDQNIHNSVKSSRRDKQRHDKQRTDKVSNNKKQKAAGQTGGANKLHSCTNAISYEMEPLRKDKTQEETAPLSNKNAAGYRPKNTSIGDKDEDMSNKNLSSTNKTAKLDEKSIIESDLTNSSTQYPAEGNDCAVANERGGDFSCDVICNDNKDKLLESRSNVPLEKSNSENFGGNGQNRGSTENTLQNAAELNGNITDSLSNIHINAAYIKETSNAQLPKTLPSDKIGLQLDQNYLNNTIPPHLPDLLNEWPNNVRYGTTKGSETEAGSENASFYQEYTAQQICHFSLQNTQKNSEDKCVTQHGGHRDISRQNMQMRHHSAAETHRGRLQLNSNKLSECNSPDAMSEFFNFHKNQQQQQQQFGAPTTMSSILASPRNLSSSNAVTAIARQDPSLRIAENNEIKVSPKYLSTRFPLSSNSTDSTTVDADLDFDPFTETQKAFSELLERENIHEQSVGSYQHCNTRPRSEERIEFSNMMHQHNALRTRMPPPGFNVPHSNALGFNAPQLNHFSKSSVPFGNHATGNDLHQHEYYRTQMNGQILPKQRPNLAPFQDQDISRSDWTAMDPAILSMCQHVTHSQQQQQQHCQNMPQSHNAESFMSYFAQQQQQRHSQALNNSFPAPYTGMGMQSNFVHPPQGQMNPNFLDMFKGRQFV